MATKKPAGQLTSRETEILSLLADGYISGEVAQILNIATNTVEVHRHKIMLKLDINHLPGVVKYALKHNLTTLDKHRDDPRLRS